MIVNQKINRSSIQSSRIRRLPVFSSHGFLMIRFVLSVNEFELIGLAVSRTARDDFILLNLGEFGIASAVERTSSGGLFRMREIAPTPPSSA